MSQDEDKNKDQEHTSKVGSFVELAGRYRSVVLLLIGIFSVTGLFCGVIYLFQGLAPSTSLPVITILGIVSLLLCLSGISYVFVQAKLEDKTQALGLPPGSIQAVIALSLIVIFSILSVFVLTSVGSNDLRSLSRLTAEERDSQIQKLGSSFAGWQPDSEGKFTIYVRDSAAESRNDIGKQLIVLIGTLMTSAISFYFGARATVAGSTVGFDRSNNQANNSASGQGANQRANTGTG
ncbi:hypothetical protein [Methylorubrum sp. SB2]|uniref:hypothetical protein n=1 Tax=Methylorubrum subtropicum TaxID=3138812 RepID=UPI00313F02E5